MCSEAHIEKASYVHQLGTFSASFIEKVRMCREGRLSYTYTYIYQNSPLTKLTSVKSIT